MDEDALEDFLCTRRHYNNLTFVWQPPPTDTYCNASYDGLICWPPTKEGDNVSLPCPYFNETTLRVHRLCGKHSRWRLSDYAECLETYTIPPWPILPALETALTYIYLVGCSLSLILLSISLFIFCYFRTLQCTRLSIHKHLVVSFILRYVCMLMILHTLPVADLKSAYSTGSVKSGDGLFENTTRSLRIVVGSTPSSGHSVPPKQRHMKVVICSAADAINVPALCRLLLTLLEYFSMCNIFWMFVEGMYLTTTLSVAVFSRETNFRLYNIVGWVSPVLAVVTWAVLMHYMERNGHCWNDHTNLPYIWVIRVPMISAIIINTVFLINIVRILLTKLRASNTTEVVKLRKTIKAVAVLFPLLGLTNLIYFWEPTKIGIADEVYLFVNAVLQSSQGIFLSIIYCFLNAEVRAAIGRKCSNRRATYFTTVAKRFRSAQMTPNGSYVIAASSEVVLALTFRQCIRTIVKPTQVDHDREMELHMEIDDGSFVNDGKFQSQV